MGNWMEKLKEDINQEDGVVFTIFTNVTSQLFKCIIFLAIPIFYMLLSS
jgi:hypothetical protein